jgi:hypothetical protein
VVQRREIDFPHAKTETYDHVQHIFIQEVL